MTKILKTVTRRVAYFPGIATCTEHRLQSSPFGLRIHAMTFDGSNKTLVRLMKGDGRRTDFSTFASKSVPTNKAEAEVQRQLAMATYIQPQRKIK